MNLQLWKGLTSFHRNYLFDYFANKREQARAYRIKMSNHGMSEVDITRSSLGYLSTSPRKGVLPQHIQAPEFLFLRNIKVFQASSLPIMLGAPINRDHTHFLCWFLSPSMQEKCFFYYVAFRPGVQEQVCTRTQSRDQKMTIKTGRQQSSTKIYL